uniref:SUMO1 activating enzyme subunit 1 n=1 Tax=Neogobius melanostomus TaxID=47308 RepID=A0A8C6U089_9GOBI
MTISDPSMISKWENLQNSRVFKYLFPHCIYIYIYIYIHIHTYIYTLERIANSFERLSITFERESAVASFCSLKQALELDWTSDKAKAALKKTPADYFLLQVLLKFRTDRGRDPDPRSFDEDSQALRQIRDDVMERLSVSPSLLNDLFSSFCFSELSPVCAVVGGVLGQEVVKALYQRDAPHRNFFFFDARKGNGVVDYFGPN